MLAHFIDSKPFQCGYFKDRQSLFEEYLLEDISEVEFDYMLAHGMRHFGEYYFRPRCGTCHECVPIRVRVDEFRMTRSQKRALKACEGIEIRMGLPQFTKQKFRLYLEHKKRFHALQDDVEDEQNFRLSFYVNTPFGMEFEYYYNGDLVGVALADVTQRSFSAIYTFYTNPAPQMSLGTFSVLKQIQLCQRRGIAYYYMGYFISHNHSLAYKANFRPNEIYVNNQWKPFRNAEGDYLVPENQVCWVNNDALVKAASHPDRTMQSI
ncbi:arginyltransferase [Nitrospina gracilis]|uniref:arginyltransferase n=1 Tax=Nitrospina gracilis TaxID=35801 RepID=UPI001F367954|nr:arginyltransferase [Nitrospina gracilis]MCF8721094.1 arginine-tRNA-protein transferase [Nitrospina gracilis Nb-211]